MMIGGAFSSSFQDPQSLQLQKTEKENNKIGNTWPSNPSNYGNSCYITDNETQQNYQPSCCINDDDDYSENKYKEWSGCCRS